MKKLLAPLFLIFLMTGWAFAQSVPMLTGCIKHQESFARGDDRPKQVVWFWMHPQAKPDGECADLHQNEADGKWNVFLPAEKKELSFSTQAQADAWIEANRCSSK